MEGRPLASEACHRVMACYDQNQIKTTDYNLNANMTVSEIKVIVLYHSMSH